MAYYLMTVTADGIYFEEVEPDKFLAGLARDAEDGVTSAPFLERLPESMGVENWPKGRILIEGHIVTPKPIEVVKRYTLE